MKLDIKCYTIDSHCLELGWLEFPVESNFYRTGKFDLTNVNNMAFSGPKLLFETTEISTHPNSTQQESNYIYLRYTQHQWLWKVHNGSALSIELFVGN
jgi:hypothetical protein